MSYKKKTSKSNGQSREVLQYCPNYKKYDKKARNESKTRINQHLSGRRGGVINCVKKAIREYKILDIPIKKGAPDFKDDNGIINSAAKQTNIQINKWDGVQIGQCKKIMIDTFEKFAKKAKNHQDQTSWKISGNYFFAPYIKKTRIFLIDYCKFITIKNKDMRMEIQNLLCLSFANALFYEEIKFHRTKPKPLMRHRTLVKSNGIHIQLEQLHNVLNIRKFIHQAKEKRKNKCGKSNIIAGEFFTKLKAFVNFQYLEQKKKVYKLLNKPIDNIEYISMDNNSDFDDNNNKNSDNDDDYIVENDDIDIRSNSPSSTPPSVGYSCENSNNFKKKCRKGKDRINTFQSINSSKKYEKDSYTKNKKANRQNKINKKTSLVRQKYCNNDFDMPQIRDCDVINALNSDFCSDCNNDNSTVSTIMTASPMQIPMYNEYNNNNNNHQSILTAAFNKRDQMMEMQKENYNLKSQIQMLRFKLAQKRTHNHNPRPMPTHVAIPRPPHPMYNAYIRQPYISYQMVPPQPQLQRQMVQPQIQIQQPPKPPKPTMIGGMEIDMEIIPPQIENNDVEELFPGGPIINNPTPFDPALFDPNQSTVNINMLPNESVDPFSTFNANMTPEPFNLNSAFL